MEPVAYDMYMRSSVERSKVCTEALFTMFSSSSPIDSLHKGNPNLSKVPVQIALSSFRASEIAHIAVQGGGWGVSSLRVRRATRFELLDLLQTTPTTYKSLPHIL